VVQLILDGLLTFCVMFGLGFGCWVLVVQPFQPASRPKSLTIPQGLGLLGLSVVATVVALVIKEALSHVAI